ncbi:uncharacterized protein LOC117231751 isoform X1 [Bombus vosnesenskii]|uniref:Uncharacterized protein LOC117231751 isoform X1 n=1 Tax=Bombus vosnesenskii TaxID=207650 RepID=A0A6J3K1D7_9HYME|nr:uncharacterized protein LOC117231751 isoform X1 [Bombus vosnesenskii]
MDKRSERVSRFKRAGVSEARGAVSGTFALFIPDRAADESRGSLAPEGRSLAFFGSQRRHDPTLSAKGIRQRSFLQIVEDQQTMMGWCSVKCSPCEQRKPTPKRMRMARNREKSIRRRGWLASIGNEAREHVFADTHVKNCDNVQRQGKGRITIPLVVIAKMPLLLATRRINQDTRATVILRWIPAPRIRRTLVRQPQSSQ